MKAIVLALMKNALLAILAATLVVPAGVAQEAKSPDVVRRGAVYRGLWGDFTVPAVRSLERQNDSSLDSRIRDGRLRITDEDALRLALENNVDINVERYGPYFSLWGVEKAKGALDPSVNFTGRVNRNVTPSSSLLQGATKVFSLSSSYDTLFRKPFETGLDLDVDYSVTRLRTNSFFTSLNPSFTPVLSLTATQHLLRDFGSASRGRFIRIARNNYSMSEEDFVTRVSGIIVDVLDAYWELVYADEDIKVKEASKRLAEVVLEQNRIQAEVGTMSELDVVQAEAEVATRNEQLVVARSSRRLAEDRLKKLISSRDDPGLIPATIEPVSQPAAPPAVARTLQEAIQSAVQNRPEVKRQLLDQENKRIQIKYAKNQLLPILDLVGGYSMNGLGGDLLIRDTSQGFFNAPVIGIDRGGFLDSMHSLLSRRYLGYVVGVTLRVPLGNNDARANSAQAQIDLRQGEERMKSLRQQVALDVRQAYENVDTSRARVETAEVTVRYSQRKLQGEQDKYSLGASTTRFVLEAQRDLQDAQSRLLRATVDLIQSRISLDKAAGEVFSAHNIELKRALGELK